MTVTKRQSGEAASIDRNEVDKFSALAEAWWDPDGEFRPLHRLNPARLSFIKDEACRHFGRDPKAARPLQRLRVLDVGCGGGLISEPLARLGAEVTGIDASQRNIAIAIAHARQMELTIDYQCTTAEALAEAGEQYDLVLALEVVEHVAAVPDFLAATAAVVKPGGGLLLSTLNRTAKAFLLAIVGAEYLLRWLPRGTHDWRRFLRPSEVSGELRKAGLETRSLAGLIYNPVNDAWRLDRRDLDVNYLLFAAKA